MTAMRRGWCPNVFQPMPSGDGLLVRIKPRLATLTAEQMRVVGAAALRFGNGVIGLTQRGNLQMRGVRAAGVEPLAHVMIDAGLASPDPRIERARNIVVSPLVDDDPTMAAQTRDIALLAEAMLSQVAKRAALPHKFGLAIDGGGVLPLADMRAYASIKLAASETSPSPLAGEGRGEGVTRVSPFPNPLPQGEGARGVGFNRYGDGARGAFGVAPPFAMLDSDTLNALADIAEALGDGTIRVSPWRTLLFSGVADANAVDVETAAEALGLVVSRSDPRLRIIACPGAPACAQATVSTRIEIQSSTTMHVSGCAKGCAHPSAAPITLVGKDGRYDLIRNGRAIDTPLHAGLTIAQAAALVAELAP